MPDTDPYEAAVPHTIGTDAEPQVDAAEDPWLNIGQAAKYMHLSISSMRRYDADGTLPATRTPGMQRRWRRSQLDAWLQRGTTAA